MVKEMPERGEIVVCKITKILDYGVFVDLLEFEGLTGFVHISQVASSWIKNIRNFVKENQIRAAKVINIDHSKNQIDLSLVKVTSGMQRQKIEEWKQFKRTQKLIEILAKDQGKDFDETWNDVAEPLLDDYETLYSAFEEIALKGEQAVSKSIPKEWISPLIKLVKKNIEIPERQVRGIVELHCFQPDGIEAIKQVLIEARDSFKGIEVNYKGSGKNTIVSTAPDYKTAEKNLKAFGEKAVSLIKERKGNGLFEVDDK